MNQVCPITDKRTDENVARLNAILTLLLAVLFISFDMWYAMLFLAVDFAIRGFGDSRFSLICIFNRWFAKTIGLSPKPINAGPKIFAAQIGVMLSALTLVLYLFDCQWACISIAGILAFFAFLEGTFGFCVACRIYPFIRKAAL